MTKPAHTTIARRESIRLDDEEYFLPSLKGYQIQKLSFLADLWHPGGSTSTILEADNESTSATNDKACRPWQDGVHSAYSLALGQQARYDWYKGMLGAKYRE